MTLELDDKVFEWKDDVQLNLHGGCELSSSNVHVDVQEVVPSNTYNDDGFSYIHQPNVTRLRQTHVCDVISGNYDKTYIQSGNVDLSDCVAILEPNVGAVAGSKGRAYASGVLVAPDLFLTARHSVAQKMIGEIIVRFGYQKKENGLYHGDVNKVHKIVEECEDLDYAILHLQRQMQFNTISLQFQQGGGDAMFIHHPNGGPKVVSVHATTESGGVFQYLRESYHDTDKGSSGGPYFFFSKELFALHLLCSDDGSRVARCINDIYEKSEILKTLYDEQGAYRNANLTLRQAVNLPIPLSGFALEYHENLERVLKPSGFEEKYPLPSIPSNFYSRHHIIPSGDMGFLWFMGEENNSIKLLLQDISYKKEGTIESVEWSLWNLFEGPNYRPNDKDNGDPKDGDSIEPRCPLSYPFNLWTEIRTLYNQIQKCWEMREKVSSAIVCSGTFSRTSEIHEMEDGTAVNFREMTCKKNSKTENRLLRDYLCTQRILFTALVNIRKICQTHKKRFPHPYDANDWEQSPNGYLVKKNE